jgi:peptidyl-prolyl cis-trans isomerase SurA
MDLDRRRVSLDSLRQKINAGNINFEQAVLQYSEDENTKNQGGKVIDGSSLGNRFDVSSLPAEVNLVLDKMKPGDVSDPVLIEEMNGNYSYVIYRLDARIEPHRADLKNDYAMFQEMAGNKLRQDKLFKWAAKKIAQTYVSVDPMYHVGPYQLPWIKGN